MNPPPRRLGILSAGIARIPALAVLAGMEPVRVCGRRAPRGIDAIAGWGMRAPALRARRYAARHGLPFVALEDGFLRSLGSGRDDAPLSLVIDDEGIYYDATRPSRLERLVARALDADETARAQALLLAWRQARVSKYNQLREPMTLPTWPYVLVVDQTRDDAAVRYGNADAASFARMLDCALTENPHCAIVVKTHPEVFAGRRDAYLAGPGIGTRPRVTLLGENVHPVGLIEHAQAVYVVSSQMGFEALLWGRPVRTFGMPFYAGWGLTQDELPAPARRGQASLAQLVHAALIDYPRYRDPETGAACAVETVLAHLALQRQQRGRFPPSVYALGFSPWKRPLVRAFLQGSTVRFVRRPAAVPAAAMLVLWGRGEPPPGLASTVSLLRLEDGFLRSVGLGADLVRPASWIADARGIYYDATTPSELEDMLQHAAFPPPLVARAARLRAAIVASGLTKYNVGACAWQRPAGVPRVILVPGQVESDASIRWGSPQPLANFELLRCVRAENPAAYIVYKPHPDVVAGLRRGVLAPEDAAACCDEVVHDCAMGALLDGVDEVHVQTSLAGFEALLRGRRVVCHGQPFFAGWGLTEDRVPVARRTRRLVLDELVAVTLLLYPRYLSRVTGRFTTPERVLAELAESRARQGGSLPWWRRPLRWLLRWRGH